MTTTTTLARAARTCATYPLVCPCGADVSLAGEDMGGSVACALGHVHVSLATLRRKGTR